MTKKKKDPSKYRYEVDLRYKGADPINVRVIMGIPMTGLLRSEWVLARYGQIIPCNWAQVDSIAWFDSVSPLGHTVADARNMICRAVAERNAEWLLFIDHDVILPPDTIVKFADYVAEAKYPVVCGWYNAKGNPPEPLLFRGRGNGWFRKWKPGDKVWVDGIPMGCTLISGKLIKAMYDASEEYMVGNQKLRRVFHTPKGQYMDPQIGVVSVTGTEDLWWCDRVMREGWLEKLGFKNYDKKYPFLVDTTIKCGHIDWNGRIF